MGHFRSFYKTTLVEQTFCLRIFQQDRRRFFTFGRQREFRGHELWGNMDKINSINK